MAADVEYVIRNRTRCARDNLKYDHRRKTWFFSASQLLDSVATHSIKQFLKTLYGSQIKTVPMDRYFHLMRAVTASKITARHVVDLLGDQWLNHLGVLMYFFDDKTYFVSKLFAATCAILGV